jgi:hypothetical protein
MFAAIGVLLLVGSVIMESKKVDLERDRGKELLKRLSKTHPADVKAGAWQAAWMWTNNAYFEGFLPFQSDPITMRRLNNELEKKIAADANLETWDWVWEQLRISTAAGTGYYDHFYGQYKDEVGSAAK